MARRRGASKSPRNGIGMANLLSFATLESDSRRSGNPPASHALRDLVLENEQRDPSGLHSSRHGTWVARNAGAGSIDVDECVKLAAELYEKATGEKYERSSA